ncbi:hypothetical protein B0H14DRAFT_2593484 [Mycena olivaceomarginata]|nr:hypothetical protein B0H14DRAFT_2593484 [Mycena olivaceomarginata]
MDFLHELGSLKCFPGTFALQTTQLQLKLKIQEAKSLKPTLCGESAPNWGFDTFFGHGYRTARRSQELAPWQTGNDDDGVKPAQFDYGELEPMGPADSIQQQQALFSDFDPNTEGTLSYGVQPSYLNAWMDTNLNESFDVLPENGEPPDPPESGVKKSTNIVHKSAAVTISAGSDDLSQVILFSCSFTPTLGFGPRALAAREALPLLHSKYIPPFQHAPEAFLGIPRKGWNAGKELGMLKCSSEA